MSIAHWIQVRTAKDLAKLYIQGYNDGRAGRPPQMEPLDDNRPDQDAPPVRPPPQPAPPVAPGLVELTSPMGYYSVAGGVTA